MLGLRLSLAIVATTSFPVVCLMKTGCNAATRAIGAWIRNSKIFFFFRLFNILIYASEYTKDIWNSHIYTLQTCMHLILCNLCNMTSNRDLSKLSAVIDKIWGKKRLIMCLQSILNSRANPPLQGGKNWFPPASVSIITTGFQSQTFQQSIKDKGWPNKNIFTLVYFTYWIV